MATLQYGNQHQSTFLDFASTMPAGRWYQKVLDSSSQSSSTLIHAQSEAILKTVTSYFDEKRRRDFHLGVRMRGLRVIGRVLKDGSLSQFTFEQFAWKTMKMRIRLRLQLLARSLEPAPEDLEIGTRGHWTPFLDWVQETFEGRTDTWYPQANWWSCNGASFRFMDLPYEIRICIYEQIATPYTWPHQATQSGRLKLYQAPVPILHKYSPVPLLIKRNPVLHISPSGHHAPQPTALPAVSKQVADEFRQVVHRYTTPHVVLSIDLPVLNMLKPAIHALHRLSLGFLNMDYFRCIGFDSAIQNPFQAIKGAPAISNLRDFPTLKHLNFHFQVMSSIRVGIRQYTFDPWAHFGAPRGDQISCQKQLVSVFLTFALEHIRHIPKITLSGHVKDSVRRKWYPIFRDESKGVRHDMSAEQTRLKSVSYTAFPPICYCKDACDWWNVNGPHPEGFEESKYSSYDLEYDLLKYERFICED